MGEGDGSRATGCDWMDYVGISEGAAGVCVCVRERCL